MNNKKAISAVVATVLIILITVAAITIIWAAVIPMIRDNLGGEVECNDATTDLTIVTEQGYTCYGTLDASGTDNDVSIQISRGTKNYNLTGIQILITVDGQTNTSRWTATNLPGGNEEKKGEVHDLSGTSIESVRIAPIIQIGNKEQVCKPSNTVTLTKCS